MRPPSVAPAVSTYSIHGGTVQASAQDDAGLVGLHVRIYNNFWRGYENDFGRTSCPVVARCIRPFLHGDGQRSTAYLVQYGGLYFPIKQATLLTCLSAEQRAARRAA